jgi:glycerol 3-phosphatase-1
VLTQTSFLRHHTAAVRSMSSRYMNRNSLTGSVSTADIQVLFVVILKDTDISHAEGLIPKEFGQDAVEIPGSRALLDKLEEQAIPWCIVTSGTRPLVSGWLDVMKLAHPKKMVTAEDVKNGKPDPACYQLGEKLLALQHSNRSIVVFEDAPAGVRSGKAAGYTVVALYTTHKLEQLTEAGADYIVQDMRSVTLKSWDKTTGIAQLEIANALV